MRSKQGIALITSLGIVLVVGALVLGSIITTQVEMAVARNDSTAAQAQYVAQAGLQTYKAALFQNFRWLEGGGLGGGGEGSETPNTDACMNSLGGGLNFDRAAGTTVTWVDNRITLAAEAVNDASGNPIGTYVVSFLRDPNNQSRITVESIGKTSAGTDTRQATAKAVATFIIRNSSTLEQAIFAGTGSGMRFLNGNTTIYGGVYVVGEPGQLVMEANGNMAIYNGYDSNKTSPAADYIVAGARSAANLCAAVRVENGSIAVGGSTQLGDPSNRLLTVAVGRGLEDIDTSKGGTLSCNGNKGVCSESGVKAFDIGSPPVFPRLDESPNTEFCTAPTTWRTCIRDEATLDGLVLTTNGTSSITVLSPAGASLPAACLTTLNAAAASGSKTITFGNSNVVCTFTDANGVKHGFEYYGGNPGRLDMFGNVNMRGLNVVFSNATKYRANSRDADGTVNMFAGLSLESIGGVGGSFTAMNNFASDNVHGRFPNNVISIIAEGMVELVGGNGVVYTAPVYAGQEFRIRANSQLYGQVIADVFCTTNKPGECKQAGSPAEVFFVPTGENRAKSFRAIAPTGGLPTFVVEAYELR